MSHTLWIRLPEKNEKKKKKLARSKAHEVPAIKEKRTHYINTVSIFFLKSCPKIRVVCIGTKLERIAIN